MTIEEIQRALAQNSGKVAARYRDQYGFIMQGVILAVNGDTVAIDSYANQVDPQKVLSIRYL